MRSEPTSQGVDCGIVPSSWYTRIPGGCGSGLSSPADAVHSLSLASPVGGGSAAGAGRPSVARLFLSILPLFAGTPTAPPLLLARRALGPCGAPGSGAGSWPGAADPPALSVKIWTRAWCSGFMFAAAPASTNASRSASRGRPDIAEMEVGMR